MAFFLLAVSVHALSFYPIKFSTWTGEIVLADNSVQIPLYIQNLGLLPDTYSIRTSVPKEYSHTLIETPLVTTEKLKTSDVSGINLKLTLSSQSTPVKILVYSNTAPIIRYMEVTVNPKPSYPIFYLATAALLAIVLFLL